MAGAHPNRSWPAFFEQGFEAPVTPLRSPGFVYRRQRRVNLPATLWQFVSRMGSYRESLRRMDSVLRETKPDLLVNFLRLMATSRAVVCSAGFESLSEAAWLGKPALAVPVEGHIEQMLNAVDMERTGLGRASGRFDLSRLDDLKVEGAHERFQSWVRESDARLDQAFSRVLTARAGMMTSRA